MSWSVSMIGTPEKVAVALEEHAGTLTGQSKVEYEAAAPQLAALVRQNFAQVPMVVKIEAAGHGVTHGSEETSRCVSVKMEYSYAKILV
jgi:predicted transcriptional regulator